MMLLVQNVENKALLPLSRSVQRIADITLLIEGNNLDPNTLENYRPVSNLAFVGKLIERVVQRRLDEHLSKHNLHIPEQSGYKKGFSTETLLIRIVNDLLIASDEGKGTVLMLLDLSAAFDTVDHNILLKILEREVGITGNALKWFKSYLQGRCQRVKVNGKISCDIIIKFGVPQGSVLGPILFNIYIRSIYRSVKVLSGFNIFGFADNHQLFKNFNLYEEYQTLVDDLPKCFQTINEWMTSHFLQLNPGKTEVIVIGMDQFLSKLTVQGTFIMPNVCIRFVSTAKNLGFRIDARLNFSNQINQLKMSSFHKLRNIAKMKPFLTQGQINQLVCALVLLPMDYCNALYYGCSSHAQQQLQYIQNRACAIVNGLKRRDSKREYMQRLHWLRIPERIEFKILLMIFKCVNGLAPSVPPRYDQSGNILANLDILTKLNLTPKA